MRLFLGFIAANAAAEEAARIAARARRARQLVGKAIFRCYQCILLLYSLYTSAGIVEQFRTQGFLRIEYIAVQRCARKSTEFASGSKIVDKNRGDMENSLVTQGSTQRGFC